MTRFERKYRTVARSLGGLELMRSSIDAMLGLSDADLLDKHAGRRFLDYYGDEGILLGLERYGFLAALDRRGYEHIEVETRALDERHTLLVFGRVKGEPDRRCRLIELVVRRDRLVPQPIEGLPAPPEAAYDVLTVDWLQLCHPLGSFTVDRPRLPGQELPGLGIGERVLELLYRMVDRLSLHALLTVAEHFHNAVLYARELPFFDPVQGGRLRALESMLMQREKLSLAQASWAVEWGLVRGIDDAVVRWSGDAQVHAHDRGLAEWIASPEHLEISQRTAASARYVLDRNWFNERWAVEHEELETGPSRAEP